MKPLIYQLVIVISTLSAAFSSGGSLGYPSILLYQLKRNDTEIPLDLDTASWLGSIHGLTGLPGVMAPLIMQWKGRKFTFIAACVVITCGWAIGYTAKSIAMIFVSESLFGFSSKVFVTVSFDYLSEMITPTYRNLAMLSYNTVTTIGFIIPGVLAMLVHWRTLSLILSIPVVISVLMSFFWLESPLWLVYMGDIDKGKKNFIKIRGTDEFSLKELQEVLAAHRTKLNTTKDLHAESMLKRYWRQISNKDFIKPAVHVFLLMNHSYFSGVIAVILYSIELISNVTQDESAAFIGNIIINLVIVIGLITSSVLTKLFKNKSVILLSTCGATICLLSASMVLYLQNVGYLDEKSLLVLYFLVGYILIASLGQTSLAFSVSAELMPVKHRGIGGAIFVIYMSILHTTLMKISPYLFVYVGLWGTFLIYSLNSIVCGFLILKYVPETKDKTLAEIENFYANGTFAIDLLPEETELINVKYN